MVAILVLSMIAIMAWRAIDGMRRAQTQTQAYSDQVLSLQAALAQWKTDLDAQIVQPPGVLLPTDIIEPVPLDWDGRALRITRRAAEGEAAGLQVVAWARRIDERGHWLRWQSAPLRTMGEWRAAWLQAARWAQTPSADDRAREVRVVPLDDWQITYFRGGAWTNAFSSDTVQAPTAPGDGAGGAPSAPVTPGSRLDGIRLVLQLPDDQALGGALTVDWVRPTRGGAL